MRTALIIFLLCISGCPALDAKAVEACGKVCGEKGVMAVDGSNCYCNRESIFGNKK